MREYGGEPMRGVLLDRLPPLSYPKFFVYVMGPYTKFELTYVLSEETDPQDVEANLGAFTAADREFITELEELCSFLRDDSGVNAFNATEPDSLTSSSQTVTEQSPRHLSFPIEQMIVRVS